MIPVPLSDEEGNSYAQSQKLCHGNCPPDPVNAPENRKEQYHRDLEYQGTEKRDGCGEQTIV